MAKNHAAELKQVIAALSGQANTLNIPVAYVKLTGSLDCALLLSQLIYWSDRTKEPEGWFYKSYQEWEEEVFLSEYQIRKHSNLLKTMGILQTKVQKVNGNPTLHYRIDFEVLSVSFLEKFKERGQKNSRNMVPEKTQGTKTKDLRGLSIYTETTYRDYTETTLMGECERSLPKTEEEVSANSKSEPAIAQQPASIPFVNESQDSNRGVGHDECSAPHFLRQEKYIHPAQKMEDRFRNRLNPWEVSYRKYDEGFVDYVAKELPPGGMNPRLKAKNYITNCSDSESGLQKISDAWDEYQAELLKRQRREREVAIAKQQLEMPVVYEPSPEFIPVSEGVSLMKNAMRRAAS